MWSTADGRLIAHPDISLVLRNTDMSRLAAGAGRARTARRQRTEQVQEADDITGPPRAHRLRAGRAARLARVRRAAGRRGLCAALRRRIERSGLVLLGALAARLCRRPRCWRAAWWCRSRRCAPARRASASATSASASTIKTGDEVEALADQFNDMAGRLQESYADLEQEGRRPYPAN